MSIGICNICARKGCTNERKFDSDLTTCSAFEESNIDWEQRRYEIAKDALIGILASPIVDGIDPNPSIYEVARHSVLLADTLIEELKKK